MLAFCLPVVLLFLVRAQDLSGNDLLAMPCLASWTSASMNASIGMQVNCTPTVVGAAQIHLEATSKLKIWEDWRLYVGIVLYLASLFLKRLPSCLPCAARSRAPDVPEDSNGFGWKAAGREEDTRVISFTSPSREDDGSDPDEELTDDVRELKIRHAVRHIHEQEQEKGFRMWVKVAHYVGIDLIMIAFVDCGYFIQFLIILTLGAFMRSATSLYSPWRLLGKEMKYEHGTITFSGENIFCALTKTHIFEVILRFIAMAILMIFLVIALWRSAAAWPAGQCNDIPWWATLLMQLAGDQQMGTRFDDVAKLWAHILRADYLVPKHPGHGIYSTKQEDFNALLDEKLCGPLVRKIRCFLALVVNGVFFAVILYTLPLLLMTSETPLDFVKDAFAVVFIVTLDDVSNPKPNTIHCPILKPVLVQHRDDGALIGADE